MFVSQNYITASFNCITVIMYDRLIQSKPNAPQSTKTLSPAPAGMPEGVSEVHQTQSPRSIQCIGLFQDSLSEFVVKGGSGIVGGAFQGYAVYYSIPTESSASE
jgi:hypothetical protein